MPSDEDYIAMAEANARGLAQRQYCKEEGCFEPKQSGNWTDYCRKHTTQSRIKR